MIQVLTLFRFGFFSAFLLGVLSPFGLVGQEPLFSIVPHARLVPEQAAHLEEILLNSTTESWDVVRVDASLLNASDVMVPIGNQLYRYTVTHRRERDQQRLSWIGLLNGRFGQCNFVVNGGKVTGSLKVEGEQYMLLPLGGGLHVLFRQKPPADEGRCIDNMNQSKGKAIEGRRDSEYGQGIDPYMLPGLEYGIEALKSGVAEDCRIRILVAYTPAAATPFDDMLSFVQLAIDEINYGNEVCQVDYEVELARVMVVNFDEGELAMDSILTLFSTEGDTIMDQIHDDRRLFDADLCALLTRPDDNFCGLAQTIRADYSSAFHVTVALNCAVNNHSFMHETGHLLGCRHDVFVDNKQTPYPHGHGYVWFPDLWRTVMAYNDFCDCQDEDINCPNDADARNTPFSPWCDRIPYWSSPDLLLNGIPLGTDTLEDNARVWNAWAPSVINFESYISNKQFYQSRVIFTDESFDIHGAHSVVIGAGETVEIQAGGYGQFRAGHEIVIGEGFFAAMGSDFSAVLEDCSPVPVFVKEATPITDTRTNRPNQRQPDLQIVQIGAYPNPFSTHLTVKMQTTLDDVADVLLIDGMGRIVRHILRNTPIAGQTIHYQNVDVTGLVSGQYYLRVITKDQEHTYAVMKI